MSNLANTKSSLAKLLAGENITVQHKKVRTAGFDVKNRVLVLPTYKKDIDPSVYDTFVAHEVGHALYTPNREDVFKDKRLFRYMNLVEDIRIERLIKSKFPGLVKSFYQGYKQLVADDFFGVKDVDIETLCFGDRLNLNAKAGYEGFFTEEEEVLAEKARKALTFEEVVEVAKEIMAYEDRQEEEQTESGEGENDDQNEGEGSDEDGEGSGDISDNNDKKENKNESKSKGKDRDEKGNSKSSEDGDGSDDEDSVEESDSKSSEDGEGSDDEDSIEESDSKSEEKSEGGADQKKQQRKEMITDESADDNYGDFLDNTAFEMGYYDMGNLIIEKYIKSFTTVASELNELFAHKDYCHLDLVEFNTFKTSNQKVVNYLHKEFEMKKNAEQSKRASESRTGSLDTTRMFKYAYDDNIFKKVMSVPNGKSHGLVMLLDWSGSMNDKLMDTVKQLMSLVMFCKRAGVAFEVYAFSDRSENNGREHVKNLENDQVVLPSGLEMINFLSSKMSGSKLNEAMANLWKVSRVACGYRKWSNDSRIDNLAHAYELGGTPLNGALLASPKLVEKFRNDHKSQIVHLVVLTDGEATDSVVVAKKNDHTDSTHSTGVRPERSMLRHGHKYFPMMRKTEHYSGRSSNVTAALLEYVKEVAKVNVIGFFLAPAKYQAMNMVASATGRNVTLTEQNEFIKNNGIALSNCGYDELYVIKSDKKSLGITNIEEDDYEFVDVKQAMKDVKNQFKEIGNSIKKQRVILNRFITTISNPKIMF